ncbi:hypothetical protein BQ9231_00128 [Cedratvirus lausannensis]|uniref:Uncharacterized protein n=1 Tax=Cedratvirus lausannensis TaxID=2023205 RepID=A0A285PWL5_9VIRU|nr:hypothetical protein Cbor_473 [Cedratvirus borely]WIL03536.1 hypothetical protein Cplu_472 [Cedratvirus plubellavi]SOB74011.1 hypothetical protein BQ9231_00128 [Cedratvirus lausannensis]
MARYVSTSFPVSESVLDDTLYITWSHRQRKEELSVQIYDRAVYIRDQTRKLLCTFVISHVYDSDTIRVHYQPTQLLFTVQASTKEKVRTLTIED